MYEQSEWLKKPIFLPVKRLAGKIVSEMTYNVSNETLKPY